MIVARMKRVLVYDPVEGKLLQVVPNNLYGTCIALSI